MVTSSNATVETRFNFSESSHIRSMFYALTRFLLKYSGITYMTQPSMRTSVWLSRSVCFHQQLAAHMRHTASCVLVSDSGIFAWKRTRPRSKNTCSGPSFYLYNYTLKLSQLSTTCLGLRLKTYDDTGTLREKKIITLLIRVQNTVFGFCKIRSHGLITVRNPRHLWGESSYLLDISDSDTPCVGKNLLLLLPRRNPNHSLMRVSHIHMEGRLQNDIHYFY